MFIASLAETGGSRFADYYASDSISDIVEKTMDYLKENTYRGKINRIIKDDEKIDKITSTGEYMIVVDDEYYYFLTIEKSDRFKRF